MATHPVFLPGKSHGQRGKESGGLQFIGSDLATEQQEQEIMVMTVLLATIYHLPTAAYKAGNDLSI